MAPTKSAAKKRTGTSTTKKTASKATSERVEKVQGKKKAAAKKKSTKELSEKDKKKLGEVREKECVTVFPCWRWLSVLITIQNPETLEEAWLGAAGNEAQSRPLVKMGTTG